MPNQISSEITGLHNSQTPESTSRSFDNVLQHTAMKSNNRRWTIWTLPKKGEKSKPLESDQLSNREETQQKDLDARKIEQPAVDRYQNNFNLSYAKVTANTGDNSDTPILNDTTSYNEELTVDGAINCDSNPSYKREDERSISYSEIVCNPENKPKTTATPLKAVKINKIARANFYQIIDKNKLPYLKKGKDAYESYLQFLKDPGSFSNKNEVFFVQQVCYYLIRSKGVWATTAFEYMIRHYQQTKNLQVFEKLAKGYLSGVENLSIKEFSEDRNKAIARDFVDIFKSQAMKLLSFISSDKFQIEITRLIESLCFMSRVVEDYTPIYLLHKLKVINKVFSIIEEKSKIIRSEVEEVKKTNAEKDFCQGMHCLFTFLKTYSHQEISNQECKINSEVIEGENEYAMRVLELANQTIIHLKIKKYQNRMQVEIARLVLKYRNVLEEHNSLQNIIQIYEKQRNELEKIDDDYNGWKNTLLARFQISLVDACSFEMHKKLTANNPRNFKSNIEKLTNEANNLNKYEMFFKSHSQSEFIKYKITQGYVSSIVKRHNILKSITDQELKKLIRKNVEKLNQLVEEVESFISHSEINVIQKNIHMYNKERLLTQKIEWLILSRDYEGKLSAAKELKSIDFNSKMGKHYKAHTLFEEFNEHEESIKILEAILNENSKHRTVYKTYRMMSFCYFDRYEKDSCTAHKWAVKALYYAHQTYLKCSDKSLCWGVYSRACEAMSCTNQDIRKFSSQLPGGLKDNCGSWEDLIRKIHSLYKD